MNRSQKIISSLLKTSIKGYVESITVICCLQYQFNAIAKIANGVNKVTEGKKLGAPKTTDRDHLYTYKFIKSINHKEIV